jgi:protease-4
MRETLQALVDGAYARRVQALVQGRRLDEARAGAAVERGLFVGRAAVQAGLVDEVALAEEWLAARAGAEPWLVRPVVDEPGGVGDLLTLLGIVPPARPRGPHVALLYAVGPVVEGGQRGQLGAYEQISGRRLAAALRQAAAEEAVRAIVLRIDSPGGSALASEMIWHAVREARSRKPVVVSMAQVAGSGGYYIACAASRIWAQPDTLTGSIGVVGGKLVVGRGLGRIGIALHEVGRGASAGLYSVARAWSGSERALMRTMMEEVYATFKQRVAEGRKLSPERVEEVARGRLWTGAAARERGLVDELGGLAAALADARQLAGLPADAAVDVYPGRPTLVDLMRQLGATAVPGPGAALLADTGVGGPVLHWIGGQLAAVLRFATEPVQTVAFPPVLASRALADPVQR